MAGSGSPLKAIIYAFCANLGIAVFKSIAYVYTGSSSMLAEAIHSFADTGNQLLLLLGLHGARRPADANHPLGYGKLSYFWSFMVAVLLFSVGGLFSIYEGWHKLNDAHPIEDAWIALLVLGVSIVLEAFSMYGCMTEVNKIRGDKSLMTWLNTARSAELVVVFGEDLAALVGLVLAFVFVSLAAISGEPRFDAYGSICIGVLLVMVAVFVGIRVKALLVGRSGDPELVAAIESLIAGDDAIEQVLNVLTLQMGPQLVLAAKIRMAPELPVEQAAVRINALEVTLKKRFPEIGWSFIEPDVHN